MRAERISEGVIEGRGFALLALWESYGWGLGWVGGGRLCLHAVDECWVHADELKHPEAALV